MNWSECHIYVYIGPCIPPPAYHRCVTSALCTLQRQAWIEWRRPASGDPRLLQHGDHSHDNAASAATLCRALWRRILPRRCRIYRVLRVFLLLNYPNVVSTTMMAFEKKSISDPESNGQHSADSYNRRGWMLCQRVSRIREGQ